jgi:hypothetical protein
MSTPKRRRHDSRDEAQLCEAMADVVGEIRETLSSVRLTRHNGLPLEAKQAIVVIEPLERAVRRLDEYLDLLRDLPELSADGALFCEATEGAVSRFFELDAELVFRADSAA